MKKLVLLLALSALLSSCNSLQTFYQFCEVKSQLSKNSEGCYEFKDENCLIKYDFWANGGNGGFIIYNNTNEVMHIDLSNSFFVKNGQSYDYFLNRIASASVGYHETASASKNSAAYGYWYNFTPGSVSASTSQSSSQSKSFSVQIQEKNIVSIAPHTCKLISEYAIANEMFYDCDNNIMPKSKQKPEYKFTLQNTPISFGNYITYKLGDDNKEYCVNNSFYVSKVSYLREKQVIREMETGCPNEKTKIKMVVGGSPDKFYIRYERKNTSDGLSVEDVDSIKAMYKRMGSAQVPRN